MKSLAEQDADHGAQNGQGHHRHHGLQRHRGHGHREPGGLHPHQGGHAEGRHGGGDAGHQARVIQHAHADDLQGEHRGGQGGAEQGGEHPAHAAQGGKGQVLLPQVQQLPGLVAQAAADLQGSALTSGAAAAQVGDHRGHKDHRHQENGHAFAEMHRLDDGVGALALQMAELIQPHDGKAPHRQQVQNPGVRPPDGRGVIDADMKQGADHAAGHTDDAAQQHPFSQRRRVCSHMHYGLFPLIHRLPPSFPPVPPKNLLPFIASFFRQSLYSIFTVWCQSGISAIPCFRKNRGLPPEKQSPRPVSFCFSCPDEAPGEAEAS